MREFEFESKHKMNYKVADCYYQIGLFIVIN